MDLKNREDVNFFESNIRKERRKKIRRHIYLEIIMIGVIIYIIFDVIVGIAVVQGDSMEPSLTDGSIAIFYRKSASYHREDIVIFHEKGEYNLLIKRIVAIAGDTVDINDEAGECYVNGVLQKGITIGQTFSIQGGQTYPFTVPEGCVFVLGDNREGAIDSRYFGAIKTDCIIGRVIFEIKHL